MRYQQTGFTLIEIVIAFTILSMATVLVVNMVTQSSIRVEKVNEHLSMMNTIESAIAVLRSEISQLKVKKTYQGVENKGYEWVAEVMNRVNPDSAGMKKYIHLFRVHIQVFEGEDPQPRLELTTVIADR